MFNLAIYSYNVFVNWQEILNSTSKAFESLPSDLPLAGLYGAVIGFIAGIPAASLWRMGRSGDLVNPPSLAKEAQIEKEKVAVFLASVAAGVFVCGALRLINVN